MKKLFDHWYYPKREQSDRLGKERNYFIDNLKFVLIILVVIGHFALKLTFVKEIKYILYFIYVFHMPCFIFVSGFLAKRMNAGGRLRADKILSIFWLYLFFKVGNVLLGYAFHEKVPLNLFKDTSAPWYLIALCIWYLSIPILERIKTNYLIIGSFLIGLLIGYINNISNILSLSRVFVFFPFFILGFCLSEKKLDEFLKKRLRFLSFTILVVFMICLFVFGKHLDSVYNIIYGSSPYSTSLGDLAPYGILVRGIWYLLAIIISAAFLILVPRCKLFISKFGERTLQIYITHIWCRNALVYVGFFTVLKSEPRYLAYLVLLGCVPLTFLLANRYLKKLFDILMATSLFKKLLNDA